jgi:hypothetical protein
MKPGGSREATVERPLAGRQKMPGNLELIERIVWNEAYQDSFRSGDHVKEVGNRERGKAYRNIPGSQKTTLERRRNRSVITQVSRSLLFNFAHEPNRPSLS